MGERFSERCAHVGGDGFKIGGLGGDEGGDGLEEVDSLGEMDEDVARDATDACANV